MPQKFLDSQPAIISFLGIKRRLSLCLGIKACASLMRRRLMMLIYDATTATAARPSLSPSLEISWSINRS